VGGLQEPAFETVHGVDASGLAERWQALLGRHLGRHSGAIPGRVAPDLAQLLSGLLGQAVLAEGCKPGPRPGSRGISRRAIEDYIEQRLADPCLSLRRIAQAFGCSVRTLHRSFNKPGVPSLARYLWRRRVEASAALLRATAFSARALTDIALDLGFYSSAHFSTLFREAFGVTPSEYRRGFQRGA
jgi:AraC-like DNA-binding protein